MLVMAERDKVAREFGMKQARTGKMTAGEVAFERQ